MTWQKPLQGEGFTAQISSPQESESSGHINPQSGGRNRGGALAGDPLSFSARYSPGFPSWGMMPPGSGLPLPGTQSRQFPRVMARGPFPGKTAGSVKLTRLTMTSWVPDISPIFLSLSGLWVYPCELPVPVELRDTVN